MKVKCKQCSGTRIVYPNESKENYEKRRPFCTICGHRNRLKTLGEHGPGWKGGKIIDKKGYIRIRVGGKYRAEHQVVWESHNGTIPNGHVIHHKDENKKNNDISNLECITKREHDLHHGDHLLKNHWNRRTQLIENLLCVE